MKKMWFAIAVLTGILFGQQNGARYLIITHDNFYNDILPLAQWKHKKGYFTKVVKLSETGSTSSQIRAYVLNAYNNWQVKPEYLLLVGGGNYLPYPSVGGVASDNYYTNMSGDFHNEILSGRLTVRSSSECQTVVNKILAYERTPEITLDSTWFRDACLVIRQDGSNPSDSIYWDDINFAAFSMVASGFRQIDTLCNYWGNGSADILNSVNNGCAFVMYRGQGVGYWWSPFDVNPDQSANGSHLPIVLSFTCSTIGTGSSPATAERWLLTGSPSQLRGAAGYFATTTVISHGAHLRSAVCQGFIKDVFNGEYPVFGKACENGRKNVYLLYPSSGGLNEYYGFNTLGDPQMNIWTATPARIDVAHDTSVYIGPASLTVTVTRGAAPVESSLVCIHLDTTVYETGYTSGSGQVTFNFTTVHPGFMDVTVTGMNLLPYEGQVTVYDTAPSLCLASSRINDSLGNSNGVPNNGETVLLYPCLWNIGQGIARDVRSAAQTSDTFAFIVDALSFYPDIPSCDSASALNPIAISISPDCPDQHVVAIRLLMREQSGDTWPADLALTVRRTEGVIGPDPYGYYIYDDTDTLSGNAPVYGWIEVDPLAGGPGQLVAEITDEDADTATYPLPFPFQYYGLMYDSIGLCSNGFAELGWSTYRFGANTRIPQLGNAKRMLAPFWDDLSPNVNGDIACFSDTSLHVWILEFKDCSHYDNGSNRETFQIVLRDPQSYPTPTGDGEVVFQYQQVADASSNTIGFEDETEARGLEYLYDGSYDPNAAPLAPLRTLLITTKPPNGGQGRPWLYLMGFTVRDSAGGNNNGIPEPGETVDIAVSIKNRGDTAAFAVEGHLATEDPDASIIDSLSAFGDIPVQGVSDNHLTPYRFLVGGSPIDSVIGFQLRLSADDGSYSAVDYFTIRLFVQFYVKESSEFNRGLAGPILTAAPNPFRDRIILSKGQSAKSMELKIYDIAGRLINSFTLGPMPSALGWNGTDQNGRAVPAGVYFASWTAGGPPRIQKMILIR